MNLTRIYNCTDYHSEIFIVTLKQRHYQSENEQLWQWQRTSHVYRKWIVREIVHDLLVYETSRLRYAPT